MNPILAFAGIDGIDDLAAPSPGLNIPPTSYAALTGPVPNPWLYPGNPDAARGAMASPVYRSQYSTWPLHWRPKSTKAVPQPMSGFGCIGGCGPMPPGATCRCGGQSGLGEVTANDLFNSLGTLVVLGGITVAALYFFVQSSKTDKGYDGGPKVDWDRLDSEWQEAARR